MKEKEKMKMNIKKEQLTHELNNIKLAEIALPVKTDKKEWHEISVYIGEGWNEWKTYDNVGVFTRDEEFENALECESLTEFFANKLAKDFLGYWNSSRDDYRENFVDLIYMLQESSAYDCYEEEIDTALELIEKGEQYPIDIDELQEIVLPYIEITDEGVYDNEDKKTAEDYFKIAIYLDDDGYIDSYSEK